MPEESPVILPADLRKQLKPTLCKIQDKPTSPQGETEHTWIHAEQRKKLKPVQGRSSVERQGGDNDMGNSS